MSHAVDHDSGHSNQDSTCNWLYLKGQPIIYGDAEIDKVMNPNNVHPPPWGAQGSYDYFDQVFPNWGDAFGVDEVGFSETLSTSWLSQVEIVYGITYAPIIIEYWGISCIRELKSPTPNMLDKLYITPVCVRGDVPQPSFIAKHPDLVAQGFNGFIVQTVFLNDEGFYLDEYENEYGSVNGVSSIPSTGVPQVNPLAQSRADDRVAAAFAAEVV